MALNLSSPLKDAAEQVFIIAYKEDTDQLETCLTDQGFTPKVLRQQHRPEYKSYSPSYLCLLNHCEAWQHIVESNQSALICEADFVPVMRMGDLPVPYDLGQPNVGIAWLYTCAPQIYFVSPQNYAVGFSTSMVAYLLTPVGARALLDLADQIARHPGPTQYSAWDSTIEEFLRKRQLDCYIPWRNYGEHGGRPNPEHKKAGLSPAHRADVLYGPLAFVPIYAESSGFPAVGVFFSRIKARVKGLGRLVLWKYLRRPVLAGSSTPRRMLKFALGRQLTLLP